MANAMLHQTWTCNAFVIKRAAAGGPASGGQPLVDPLTPRELEVLAEIAAGLTNAEIAERLYISVGTTKRHVANIFVKKNRTRQLLELFHVLQKDLVLDEYFGFS